MATVKLHQPINMNNLPAWDGEFTIIETGHIRATDGVRSQDYFGLFQFGDNEITGGTLTSTVAYQNGLYYEITGLNADAVTTAEAIGSFDIKAAMNELFKGNDTFIGSGGNDLFRASAGSDHYDGGTGIDTVWYSAGKGSATVKTSGAGHTVNIAGKTDSLVNIERIGFGDGSTLAIDTAAGENAGSAYRLYQAAFDRKPDTAGLNYWLKQLDSGTSLAQIAGGFVQSNEFKTLNPGNDPGTLINNYYQHVLHRSADTTGFNYWSSAMANGMSASDVLIAFSESNENISATSAVLNGGLWLS